ncbi:ferredoxin-type protein [Gammaproteobacteria bacterium]|nr:ferredoxin-type protein [Gammaproteobacteria bacterium]
MSNRRDFFVNVFKVGSALCLGALPLGMLAHRAKASNQYVIRPPGALAETDFLSACTRCGLCVRACPYDTLKLADGLDATSTTLGTPYFIPRTIPCEMCEDIPCVVACPTGALDHNLTNIDDAKMGTAVLVDQENCLAFLGLRCEVCYRVCPAIDKAITLNRVENKRTGRHAEFIPVVHMEFCTGCGKCEEACILPIEKSAAIQVLPLHIARSTLAEHYRLGWREKEINHNKPLIENVIDLPNRIPAAGQDSSQDPSQAPKVIQQTDDFNKDDFNTGDLN